MSQDPGSGSPMSERMQSLLSRAVEDQLSEQRQLAGALTDVRTQLAQLGSQLESLRSQPAGGSERVEQALAGLNVDLREAVRLLAERLDGVGRLVQERGRDLAEQRAAITELKDAIEDHSRALEGVTGGLQALPAFGERIDTLQDGLGGLTDRLRGLEELNAAIAVVQQRAEAHDAGLRELRQAFTGVASRAAQLPAREDIEGMLHPVTGSVDAIGNRLGRLETAVPSVLERLDELAATLGEHGTGLADLRDEITALGAATPSDATGSAERSTALEDMLTGIHQRLEELAERSGAGGGAELAGQLDALHEAVLGEDGVAAQVRALGLDAEYADERHRAEDARLQEAVAEAVAQSEERLREHIDEAVLALAEAVLRRRPSRLRAEVTPPVTAVAPPAAPAPAPEPVVTAPEATEEPAPEGDTGSPADSGGPAPDPAAAGAPAHRQSSPDPEAFPPDEVPAAHKRRWWHPGD